MMSPRRTGAACSLLVLLALAACASRGPAGPEPRPEPPPAPDAWLAPMAAAQAAFQERRFAESIESGQRALDLAQQSLGADSEPVGALNALLARAHFATGAVDLAAQHAGEARRIQERLYGPDDPRVGSILITLGAAELLQEKREAAQGNLERALVILDAAGLMTDPDNAVLLTNLARIHYTRGEYHRAEAYYLRTLKVYRDAYGRDHEKVGLTLGDLGAVYLATRRPRMAAQSFQRAYQILVVALGPDHAAVLQTRANLTAALERLQHQQRTPRLGI